MSLAILFHLLCAQHVSDINISIFRSLRLCWRVTTSVFLFSVLCVLELLLRLIFGGVRFAGWSRRKSSNTQRTENKTTDVVIHQHSRRLLKMDILMSETCWAHNKWNKVASDMKLVFHSSTIAMMHGPINISSKWTSSKIIKWRISGCLFTTVKKKLLTKCTSWSKITVWKFSHDVSLWVWKCKTEWSVRRSGLLHMLRATECLRADRLEAATDSGSYSFSVFQCQPSVCLRVCHLLQKQRFETSVVIMNGSMSPSGKILSVLLLRCCNWVVISVKRLYGESTV